MIKTIEPYEDGFTLDIAAPGGLTRLLNTVVRMRGEVARLRVTGQTMTEVTQLLADAGHAAQVCVENEHGDHWSITLAPASAAKAANQ